MKKNILSLHFMLATLLTGFLAGAQQDRFAYAITDVQKGGSNWSVLRKLDLRSNHFSDVLLNGNEAGRSVYDAVSKKELTSFATEKNRGFSMQPAFSSGVAAMAYDRKNNRLWYTPMLIDQLRYIDLKTMKVYYFNSDFSGMPQKSADQGNIITRMTIGDDGNGYALTNDGAHLIRFTTGKNIVVTDLGMLADDPAGKGLSIHSSCSSFGGDMIADNSGNLYVFSARNNIFRVNIETKIATHVGTLSGVPDAFTANGAAVTPDNRIVITSAMDDNHMYRVNPQDWSAEAITNENGWRSSDLANGNILNTRKSATMELAAKPIAPAESGPSNVLIYPNPVTNSQFTIQFTKLEAGNYTIELTDAMGRQILQRAVKVAAADQLETVQLKAGIAKGFYLVKITDNDNKVAAATKLLVQ